MKKIFAILLVLTVFLSFAVTAYAQTINENGGFQTTDVKLTSSVFSEPDIYSVTITFEDMSFSYSGGSKIWQPASHSYSESNSGWVKDTSSFKVTNNSNVGINIEPFACAPGTTNYDVSNPRVYYNNNVNTSILGGLNGLERCEENAAAGPNCTFTVKLEGEPQTALTNETIATILVRISKAS